MTKQKIVSVDVTTLKKSFTTFLSKFGKTPPEMISFSMRDKEMNFYGTIPGTRVLVNVPGALMNDDSKVNLLATLSLENMKTFTSIKGDFELESDDSSINTKCGRTKLKLPRETTIDIPEMPEIIYTLTNEFTDFLSYSLPILKKTTSALARSETHLECRTEQFAGFAIVSFVGSKIHLIETDSQDLRVFEKSKRGTTAVIPFDLLEGLSDQEQMPMIELEGNSIILKTNSSITITQTREHSLGVGYEAVANMVKVADEDAVVFKMKADSLHDILQSLPSIPGNSEYDFKLKLDESRLHIMYGSKGVKFNADIKVKMKSETTEPVEFALEIKELQSVMTALADIGVPLTVSVMKSRVMFTVKSSLSYNHYVAMSRVN